MPASAVNSMIDRAAASFHTDVSKPVAARVGPPHAEAKASMAGRAVSQAMQAKRAPRSSKVCASRRPTHSDKRKAGSRAPYEPISPLSVTGGFIAAAKVRSAVEMPKHHADACVSGQVTPRESATILLRASAPRETLACRAETQRARQVQKLRSRARCSVSHACVAL